MKFYNRKDDAIIRRTPVNFLLCLCACDVRSVSIHIFRPQAGDAFPQNEEDGFRLCRGEVLHGDFPF